MTLGFHVRDNKYVEWLGNMAKGKYRDLKYFLKVFNELFHKEYYAFPTVFTQISKTFCF